VRFNVPFRDSDSLRSLLSILPAKQRLRLQHAKRACCPLCQSKQVWGKEASLGQKGNEVGDIFRLVIWE